MIDPQDLTSDELEMITHVVHVINDRVPTPCFSAPGVISTQIGDYHVVNQFRADPGSTSFAELERDYGSQLENGQNILLTNQVIFFRVAWDEPENSTDSIDFTIEILQR